MNTRPEKSRRSFLRTAAGAAAAAFGLASCDAVAVATPAEGPGAVAVPPESFAGTVEGPLPGYPGMYLVAVNGDPGRRVRAWNIEEHAGDGYAVPHRVPRGAAVTVHQWDGRHVFGLEPAAVPGLWPGRIVDGLAFDPASGTYDDVRYWVTLPVPARPVVRL